MRKKLLIISGIIISITVVGVGAYKIAMGLIYAPISKGTTD